MNQSTKIRVLIVDDHSLVTEGLANIINYDPEMIVVAQAGDGQQAIDCYREHQPDITLMDLRMPGMGGVEARTYANSLYVGCVNASVTHHPTIFRATA
ncbi:response regulator transcription factor [Aerosakkonemataceae cyanobacterium BLCC-F50]|uniref:Response regulator transcription factor n=1 Tax=Floridaenema flaviceps BLCC-F50 TaxID=3153642 RepID=A0ABV4XT00_9CYAN